MVAASTGHRAPARALATDVERVFALLSIRERSLLWLAYVEGATHAEIARALDCGEKSVRVLLFRARKKMEESFAEVQVVCRRLAMNDADFERAMRILASGSEEKPLPDAALLWIKAAARRRLDESERATRPIRIAEATVAAVSVAAAMVLFPFGILETLHPIVFWVSGVAFAGVAAVWMVLLKLLLAEE